MNKMIEIIKTKLESLNQMIEEVLKDWDSYKEDCDSDWIRELEDLKVKKGLPLTVDISKIKTKYGFSLPTPYIEFVNYIGVFDIGLGELKLRGPEQLHLSLGDLIKSEMPDHLLDNFEDGHYHDFIVICEYGTFPSEIHDYSSGLAFNRRNTDEMIEYSCDDIWVASTFEKRKSSSSKNVFFGFIEEKIDRLIKRAEEPVEGLRSEIDYYENNEE